MQNKKGTWTKEDIKTLKKEFPSHTTEWVASLLMRPLEAVKKKASRMGLRKSAKYMRTIGRTV